MQIMAETGSYSYATSSATSSAMSAMSVEKPDGLVLDRDNLSPELLKILDEVDRDGDGDVDINELLMAFQEMHHARKSNKRLVRILIVGAVLFALTLGAIFALSVAAAELAKDTNIESSSSAPAVMRTKSGGSEYASTVRTASVTPGISVGTVDDPPEDDDASRALRARAREVEGRTSEVDTADLSVLCESAETEVTDDFTFDTALVFPRPDSVENIRTNPTAPFSLSLPGQASTQIMRFRITGISSFDNNTFDSIPEETELDVTDLVVDGDAEAAARLCCDHANCAYAVGESIIEMEDDSTYVNGTAVDPPSAGELDEAASRWVMNRYGEMVEPGREHEAATERAIGARVTISTGLQRYLTGRCTRRVCYVRGLMQGSGVLRPRGVTVYSPNAAKTTYASVKPMRVRPRTLVVCPVNGAVDQNNRPQNDLNNNLHLLIKSSVARYATIYERRGYSQRASYARAIANRASAALAQALSSSTAECPSGHRMTVWRTFTGYRMAIRDNKGQFLYNPLHWGDTTPVTYCYCAVTKADSAARKSALLKKIEANKKLTDARRRRQIERANKLRANRNRLRAQSAAKRRAAQRKALAARRRARQQDQCRK